MLVVGNRRYKKQYVIGRAGIFDSILQFFIRTFTSQTAKEAAKHVGKAASEAGKRKTVAVDAGKKLIDKAMQPKTSKKTLSQNIRLTRQKVVLLPFKTWLKD